MKAKKLNCLSLLSLLMLAACGDGGDESVSTSSVSVGFSDFPIQEVEAVVLTVESLSFRSDDELIVVEQFTSKDLGLEAAERFSFDLLDVQGNDYKLVLDDVELPIGQYQSLIVNVLAHDIEQSYVLETDSNTPLELKVPSGELKLGAFNVDERSTQTLIVEFDLNQAMTYNPSPERYILKPRGVRIVGLEQAATLVGDVDLIALHQVEACSDKAELELGNAVYLYPGHGHDVSLLSDAHDSLASAPSTIVMPYAIAPVLADGSYQMPFIEAGDYTLAFNCLASEDNNDLYQRQQIPLPSTELIELSFAPGEDALCNLPQQNGQCGP
ncbi:DUF4382 domain-containing protein [Agaribacterium haliotis]|uniref:DUF4382 domain-containing protein n=1 Tax=Agaribacterium haliotis TaxID=2013869 RepID=UPI000BB56A6E|nr:DUF4382 domain-containing protein [Agaribacterium haliotis]